VKAGQITTLLTRPQGAREVINPGPAEGGEDAEAPDDARASLPLTVMTLDRIVSLQDYGDFAHAYAGIAKALATWTWSGEQRGVFVTVAGPNGAEISRDSKTIPNLLTAMRLKGDPGVPLSVKSFQSRKFNLKAAVKVDRPAYERESVFERVTRALLDTFSFKRREFGQAVTLSEVIAVIQAQDGVLAVDVNELRREGASLDGTKEPLTAALPQSGADGVTVAAELLTLDAAGIELSEM
jgi:predicted phage baseplate assembly protein